MSPYAHPALRDASAACVPRIARPCARPRNRRDPSRRRFAHRGLGRSPCEWGPQDQEPRASCAQKREQKLVWPWVPASV